MLAFHFSIVPVMASIRYQHEAPITNRGKFCRCAKHQKRPGYGMSPVAV